MATALRSSVPHGSDNAVTDWGDIAIDLATSQAISSSNDTNEMTRSEFDVSSRDRLVAIRGTAGDNVLQIQFFTRRVSPTSDPDLAASPVWGGRDGPRFAIEAPPRHYIAGFHTAVDDSGLLSVGAAFFCPDRRVDVCCDLSKGHSYFRTRCRAQYSVLAVWYLIGACAIAKWSPYITAFLNNTSVAFNIVMCLVCVANAVRFTAVTETLTLLLVIFAFLRGVVQLAVFVKAAIIDRCVRRRNADEDQAHQTFEADPNEEPSQQQHSRRADNDASARALSVPMLLASADASRRQTSSPTAHVPTLREREAARNAAAGSSSPNGSAYQPPPAMAAAVEAGGSSPQQPHQQSPDAVRSATKLDVAPSPDQSTTGAPPPDGRHQKQNPLAALLLGGGSKPPSAAVAYAKADAMMAFGGESPSPVRPSLQQDPTTRLQVSLWSDDEDGSSGGDDGGSSPRRGADRASAAVPVAAPAAQRAASASVPKPTGLIVFTSSDDDDDEPLVARAPPLPPPPAGRLLQLDTSSSDDDDISNGVRGAQQRNAFGAHSSPSNDSDDDGGLLSRIVASPPSSNRLNTGINPRAASTSRRDAPPLPRSEL